MFRVPDMVDEINQRIGLSSYTLYNKGKLLNHCVGAYFHESDKIVYLAVYKLDEKGNPIYNHARYSTEIITIQIPRRDFKVLRENCQDMTVDFLKVANDYMIF